MSFQQKCFWTPRDGACLTNGEMHCDNSSRSESKRCHHWFMDADAPELFSNKKQAIESVDSQPVSGIADINVSPWHNDSSYQSVSGQFGDRLFGSKPKKTVNVVDRNISSVESGNMNTGRKDFEDQYNNSSEEGLSMPHTIEDAPCLSFGGIRKVKVNQVKDSTNSMPTSVGHPYSIGVNSIASMSTVYSTSGNKGISLDSTYGSRDENTISLSPTFTKAYAHFTSMGHTFNKRDADFISVGHNYDKGNESILLMDPPFDKEDDNFISMRQSYAKGDTNLTSLGPSYANLISMVPSFDKEDDNIQMQPSYNEAECNITTIAPVQGRGESSILFMHQNYNKGDSNTISFGSFNGESETNPSCSINDGYDLLMNNQHPIQSSELPNQQQLVQSNPEINVNGAPKSIPRADTNLKHKEPRTAKKVSPNNFPSNVKSLLSTGMLDGVVVKYVSWSQETSLKAYIQGIGYLCGCKDCKFEKALNAYEFERHANCKTKHPNNHIYFENGKTIYAVVQEHKNTPQEMLFDVIQNVTGSQINQKNFRIWKASYQAATRELQRIYGTDDATVLS